ncbi:MAG: M23 family metallopeptidase [Desulfobacterota bacterium]|nr:M23 family metallopeptidase [Thermodesulfobacteriota bacterium]
MRTTNTITIIVQPDWKKKRGGIRSTTTIRLPKRILYYALIGFMMLICFGINGSRAISKNIMLHITVAAHRQALDNLRSIEKRVDRVSREQGIIRSFLGIENSAPAFDVNERKGVGGSHPNLTMSLTPLKFEEEMNVPSFEAVPLHKRVHDLYDDVHELSATLSKMAKRLTCTPTILPVQDDDIWITSWFGWRRSPFTGLKEFHKGLDLSGRRGTPILVTADGTVSEIGTDRFIGNYIVIKHDARYTTVYAHLLQVSVKQGQQVKRGQVIASMGNSGLSTGFHLHYEVIHNNKNVDPYNFILNRTDSILTAKAVY